MLAHRGQEAGYQDRWIEFPQGRIFARIWSQHGSVIGPIPDTPIVLLHDSLGCVELWRGFPALLSTTTGRTVIAYDRLGFGKSDARSDRLSLDFIADEARTYFPEICRQLGFDRFIVMGHSVGGGMAVNCAAAYSDTCDALITESAQAFVEDKILQGISKAKELFRKAGQIDRLRKYHGDNAEWVLHAWTETWLNPGFTTWSLDPALPKVTCPVLVIHGLHDEYGSTRHPEIIGQCTTGRSRIEILPDTYHVPHRENEQAIVKMVADFIASTAHAHCRP